MDISLSALTNPLKHFVDRYHPTIFFAIIGLLLAAAVFLLYLVLQIPSTPDENAATPSISSTFSNQEKETIKQIQELRESSESASDLTFPSPRSNPFVE
jgi:predicted PurR-regulated permease PerM